VESCIPKSSPQSFIARRYNLSPTQDIYSSIKPSFTFLLLRLGLIAQPHLDAIQVMHDWRGVR
jgi:hypothetical protein